MPGAGTLLVLLLAHPYAGVAAEKDEPMVYCEVSQVNFAWGYQHSGVFIDPLGTIGEFNHEPDDRASVSNPSDTVSSGELLEKYLPGRRMISRVCPQQYAWMRQRLEEARYAGTSEPTGTGTADAGTTLTQCFLFHRDRDAGERVVLRMDGTLELHSLASGATELANWLEAVAVEARERADIPAKNRGCIANPPALHRLPAIEQTEASRTLALRKLASAQGLHCRMQTGQMAIVEGTEQRRTPGGWDVDYADLDLDKGTGRSISGGFARAVRVSLGPTALVIEDEALTKQGASSVTTVVAYSEAGMYRFPAAVSSVHSSGTGLVSTQHIGWCTVIPRP